MIHVVPNEFLITITLVLVHPNYVQILTFAHKSLGHPGRKAHQTLNWKGSEINSMKLAERARTHNAEWFMSPKHPRYKNKFINLFRLRSHQKRFPNFHLLSNIMMLNFHFATELFSRPFRRRLHFDKFFFCIFSCVSGFFFFFLLLQPNRNVTLATDKNWNEKSSREGNAKELSTKRNFFSSRNFLFLGRLQTNYRRPSIQSTKRETQLVCGCRLTPTLSTVEARLKLPTPLHVQRVAKGKSDWKGLEEESAGERSLYRRWPAKLTASRSPSISMTTFTQLCWTERRIAWFAPHFAPNPNKLCCSFCCRRWNSNIKAMFHPLHPEFHCRRRRWWASDWQLA